MLKVIIIGGMAAGCKAASRLKRLCSNYQITIVEKNPFVSISSCGLPLYASGEIGDLPDLAKTPYGVIRNEKFFHDIKGVEVLTNTKAEKIDVVRNELVCRSLNNDEAFTIKYDALILATGSKPKAPNFQYPLSPAVSFLHSPSDSKNFREAVQKRKINKAVIIGSNYPAFELIETLTTLWGIDTVLIEDEDRLLPEFLDPEISFYIESCIEKKVQLMLSTPVKKIEIDQKGSPVILLNNNQKISCDYISLCTGVNPNTRLAYQANIKTGKFNGIIVDEQLRTNQPNIWAAGDCIEIKNLVTNSFDYFSSGSLANETGRIAADSVAGKPALFKGASGTFSLNVFDNILYSAGLTEAKTKSEGLNAASVTGCCSDKPEYNPEAKKVFGKLIYEKNSLRLLGLQLIGECELARYSDLFSFLLSERKTVNDLISLQHIVSDASSSPISPLNYLGYMALNQEIDGIKNFNPLSFHSYKGKIIDVRELSEVELDPYPGSSIHIQLDKLKSKIKDFNLNESLMFICGMGSRGYEAARFFNNSGYKNASYLGGGNLLYKKIMKRAITRQEVL